MFDIHTQIQTQTDTYLHTDTDTQLHTHNHTITYTHTNQHSETKTRMFIECVGQMIPTWDLVGTVTMLFSYKICKYDNMFTNLVNLFVTCWLSLFFISQYFVYYAFRVCQILLKMHFSLKLITGSEKVEPFDVLKMGNISYFHLEHSNCYLFFIF